MKELYSNIMKSAKFKISTLTQPGRG